MGARRTVQGFIVAGVAAGLLAGVGGIVVGTQAIAQTQTVSATTTVNIRSQATKSSAVLAVLSRGERIEATGASKNGWTPVSFRGKTAYVFSSYLKSVGATVSSGTSTTKATTMTTTDFLNVRTGPGTNYSVVGVLSEGASVALTGTKSGNWVQITFKGQRRWVASGYLTSGKAVNVSAAGVATCTVDVRSSSGASFTRIGKATKGTTLQLTGVKQGGVVQLVWKGQVGWVNAGCVKSYVASQPTKTSASSSSTVTRYTTANLNIRLTSTPSSRVVAVVPKGAALQLTGSVKNNMAQVLYNGGKYWTSMTYLSSTKPSTSSSAAPKTSGSSSSTTSTKYATANLNLRSAPSTTGRVVTVVAKGKALTTTGLTANKFTQVIYNNAKVWASSSYLSSTKPSTSSSSSSSSSSSYSGGGSVGLSKLKASTMKVVTTMRAKYPKFVTFYGVRSDPLPDHPSGYAFDAMLPNYKVNNAYGWAAANYLRANAKSLGIQYIIFDQKIWNVSRSSEGWRSMANRGSDTANHKNHIHVTMKGLSIYS